jgi:hypothetical protein
MRVPTIRVAMAISEQVHGVSQVTGFVTLTWDEWLDLVGRTELEPMAYLLEDEADILFESGEVVIEVGNSLYLIRLEVSKI